jgi:hypothetical protein
MAAHAFAQKTGSSAAVGEEIRSLVPSAQTAAAGCGSKDLGIRAGWPITARAGVRRRPLTF